MIRRKTKLVAIPAISIAAAMLLIWGCAGRRVTKDTVVEEISKVERYGVTYISKKYGSSD